MSKKINTDFLSLFPLISDEEFDKVKGKVETLINETNHDNQLFWVQVARSMYGIKGAKEKALAMFRFNWLETLKRYKYDCLELGLDEQQQKDLNIVLVCRYRLLKQISNLLYIKYDNSSSIIQRYVAFKGAEYIYVFNKWLQGKSSLRDVLKVKNITSVSYEIGITCDGMFEEELTSFFKLNDNIPDLLSKYLSKLEDEVSEELNIEVASGI